MSSSASVFSNIGSPNTYSLSVTGANTQATALAGFSSGGGACRIYNSGTVAVQVVFGVGAQIAALSVPGTPAAGYVIAPGAVEIVGIPANSDSFAAIGAGAGPSVVYVTRGDGL